MSEMRVHSADAGPAPLLEAVSLTKSFEMAGQTIDVLRGVDLRVEVGDMVAVVGRSGSGKSTLLHLLGALDTPTSGRVMYEGRCVSELPDDELSTFRNRTIGFVFQFHHLLPELTAIENVVMPGLISRGDPEEVRTRAKALLDRVGLKDRLEHFPGELSGGEQQRVALARALLMAPRVVFADEPTGNLDGGTAEEMHVLMEELNRETKTSFVVVSHNPELAARMGRVWVMKRGVVVSQGDA